LYTEELFVFYFFFASDVVLNVLLITLFAYPMYCHEQELYATPGIIYTAQVQKHHAASQKIIRKTLILTVIMVTVTSLALLVEALLAGGLHHLSLATFGAQLGPPIDIIVSVILCHIMSNKWMPLSFKPNGKSDATQKRTNNTQLVEDGSYFSANTRKISTLWLEAPMHRKISCTQGVDSPLYAHNRKTSTTLGV
jgi:hypothetical protein